MDGFEVNKILMALILALLIGMVAGKIGDILVSPQKLAQNVYMVEGISEQAETASGGAASEKLEPIEPLLASANPQEGQNIAKKCLQCHSFEKGGSAKVGPNLWGIVNAKLGHVEGYAYSQSLKEKGGQWTYENLNAFLYKPKAFIQGTKMAFVGIKKAKDRADLIAYLRTLSDTPAALPSP
jgi:cytochrome c